jgi:YggT family protein
MAGIISFIVGIIELLVGLRFVFLLAGANPLSSFVAWVYGTSGPLVAPFEGILGHPAVLAPGAVVRSVFDPASLVAFIVYAAIGGVIIALFRR